MIGGAVFVIWPLAFVLAAVEPIAVGLAGGALGIDWLPNGALLGADACGFEAVDEMVAAAGPGWFVGVLVADCCGLFQFSSDHQSSDLDDCFFASCGAAAIDCEAGEAGSPLSVRPIVACGVVELLVLLNDILDFSRVEARKLELDSIEFGLRDLLGDALRSLAVRAQEKGLELACRISPDLPDTVFLRNWDPFRYKALERREELPYLNFCGCHVSFKKQFMLTFGMFLERKGAAHEDVEVAWRLHRAGGMRLVYRKDALAYHHHPETIDSACRRAYERGRNFDVLAELVPDPAIYVRNHLVTLKTLPVWVYHRGNSQERDALTNERITGVTEGQARQRYGSRSYAVADQYSLTGAFPGTVRR